MGLKPICNYSHVWNCWHEHNYSLLIYFAFRMYDTYFWCTVTLMCVCVDELGVDWESVTARLDCPSPVRLLGLTEHVVVEGEAVVHAAEAVRQARDGVRVFVHIARLEEEEPSACNAAQDALRTPPSPGPAHWRPQQLQLLAFSFEIKQIFFNGLCPLPVFLQNRLDWLLQTFVSRNHRSSFIN